MKSAKTIARNLEQSQLQDDLALGEQIEQMKELLK
jgi:hypothetical protein